MKYTLYNKTSYTIEGVSKVLSYIDLPYKDYYILDSTDISLHLSDIHTYVTTPAFMEKQKTLVISIISAIIGVTRENIERNGVPYTFPNLASDVIQTRYDIDFRNLNSLMSVAMLYTTANPTGIFKFRCDSNNDYILNPTEMIQMCSYVIGYVSFLYDKAWTKKQEISTLSYEQLLTYDINVGWT